MDERVIDQALKENELLGERAMKTGPWNWNCVQWSSSLAKRQNSKIKANIPTILYY